MQNLTSKHYKKSRLKNLFRFSIKKFFQMGLLIMIGEYMLLGVIRFSISSKNAVSYYMNIPSQIVHLAVSEKPILEMTARVVEAYESATKKIDFDRIIQDQHPVNVKGARPDFRTLELQDKEGAQIGYVVKF